MLAVGVGRVPTALGRAVALRVRPAIRAVMKTAARSRPATASFGSFTLRVDDVLLQAITALALRVGIEAS